MPEVIRKRLEHEPDPTAFLERPLPPGPVSGPSTGAEPAQSADAQRPLMAHLKGQPCAPRTPYLQT